jgi:DNA repair/transcription protein MET18/MMS19
VSLTVVALTDNRQVVIKGLSAICGAYSSLIESATLPLLFHSLPDRAPPTSDIVGRSKYRSILASLSELCVQQSLFETLVIRINNKLEHLSSTPITASSGDETYDEARECTIAYAWDLINTLSTVIESKLKAKHVDVVKYFDQIIPRLYGLAIAAAAPRVGDVIPIFRDRRLLNVVARVSETLTWELNTE